MSKQEALKKIQEAKETRAKELDLSKLNLVEIPKELGELTQLIKLNLDFNSIPEIKNLEQLQNLTQLYLNNNRIAEIKGLEQLQNLTQLYLNSNRIAEIKGLEQLQNLTQLYLNNNRIAEIKGLGRLIQLSKLEIGYNNINRIKGLSQLTKLTSIYLAKNKIKEIEGLENSYQLTGLFLGINQISEIKGLDQLSRLTEVNLVHNQISEIKGLDQLSQLTALWLIGNRINEINGLNRSTKLNDLNLSENQISEIKNLEQLQNLNRLNLSSNQITEIKGLDSLTKLTQLRLSSNQITEIKGLDSLTKLTQLRLSSNQITEIKGLDSLTKLTQLRLFSNQITEVKNLNQLSQLTMLDLSENKISKIPKYLLKLNQPITSKERSSSVMGIYIDKNPIVTPPPEIINQGNKAIARYFKELELEDGKPLQEAKLLIIGAGGVGKTSFMVKLKDPNADLPKQEATTVGITVTQEPKSYPIEGVDHILHIWDFGGQDIYHPTHQFFLTKNSIYILMQDGREQKTDFYYWLQVQELLADKSPLFIIQNIKDNSRCAIPINELKAKFGNIKDYFEVDLLEVREGHSDFEKIVTFLKANLKTLPHIGEIWPAKRFAIRDALLQLKKDNYISYKEYSELCNQHDYTDLQGQKELLQQLHFLGTVLHFVDNSILEDIVITNPQWATDAVYAILDHTKKHYEKQGQFNWQDLRRVWHEDRYQGKYMEILTLMEKFELSFELPDKKNTFIAPLLLPDDMPDFAWEDTDNLQMQYNYDFMPKGILARLIVRLHPHIKERLFWKRGVYLELEDTLARITEDYNSRNLSIAVKGKKAKELIFMITTTIDNINRSYHFSDRIKATKLVPCNCYSCSATISPHFYDYKVLVRRLRKSKKKTIECIISEEDVHVKSLLENITPKMDNSKRIFISYAHEDIVYRNEFEKRLRPLLRQKKIEDIWYDHKIAPGQNWDKTIEANLKSADIIVLLISDDFWASNYIHEKELPIIQQRYEEKDCIVLPIIVRVNAYWEGSTWQSIQGAPIDLTSGRLTPIDSWSNEDAAWKVVVEGIREWL